MGDRVAEACEAVGRLTHLEWLALRKAVDEEFERSSAPVLDWAEQETTRRTSGMICEVSPEAVARELELLL